MTGASSSTSDSVSTRRAGPNPFARSGPPHEAQSSSSSAPLRLDQSRRQAVLDAAADLDGDSSGSDMEPNPAEEQVEPMDGVEEGTLAGPSPDSQAEINVDDGEDEDDPLLLVGHRRDPEELVKARQLIVIRKALEALEDRLRYEGQSPMTLRSSVALRVLTLVTLAFL